MEWHVDLASKADQIEEKAQLLKATGHFSDT
jgi:hypothetical protein